MEKPVEMCLPAENKVTKMNGYSGLHRIRTPAQLLKIGPEEWLKPAIFRVFSRLVVDRVNIDAAFSRNPGGL